KKAGDAVRRDENLVDLETDKVVLEVPAPADGVLKEIVAADGAVVTSGQVLAVLEPGEAGAAQASAAGKAPANPAAEASAAKAPAKPAPAAQKAAPAAKPAPAAAKPSAPTAAEADTARASAASRMGPAVRKLVEEHDL